MREPHAERSSFASPEFHQVIVPVSSDVDELSEAFAKAVG
jgi:hypothetical protein